MAPAATPGSSDLLQQRLRDKKAETSRSHKPGEQSNGTRAEQRPGRDDHIFEDDDDVQPKRSGNQRSFQSSPNGPAQHPTQRSRTNKLAASTSSASPGMGIREAQEKVDKLLKDNFDLKLEVYHRREKCGQLEKKLANMTQLEDDNTELWDVNREAMNELDKRDRAIDEAVVMICELEEKAKTLQEELENSRPSTARQKQLANAGPDQSQDQAASLSPDRGFSRVVSPRRRGPRNVPSFIDTDDTATNALRSIYMDGDKWIRPIPSYASLLSQPLPLEQHDLVQEPSSPPKLSDLRDLNLGGLAARPQSQSTEQSMAVEDDGPESPPRQSLASREGRFARTNKWVARSAVSPPKTSKNARSMSSGAESFQSLGDVLHQDRFDPESAFASRPVDRFAAGFSRPKKGHIVPTVAVNPMYGQHVYPPTPDTMLTRPSTHSSSSIVHDRSLADRNPAPTNGYASLLPTLDLEQPTETHNQSGFTTSLLPPELDSPKADNGSRKLMHQPSYDASFGASLFQHEGYTSDDSMSYTPRGRGYDPASPSRRANYDPISSYNLSPSRFHEPSARTISSRRPSTDESQASVGPSRSTRRREPARSLNQMQRPSSLVRTTSASAASSSSQPALTPTKPLQRNAFTRARPSPTRPSLDTAIPVYRRLRIPSSRPETPTPQTIAAAPAPAPAESVSTGRTTLRQRVARLARRNSAANGDATNDAGGGASGTAPPALRGRSNSITRRLFQRRGSSGQHSAVGVSNWKDGVQDLSDLAHGTTAPEIAQAQAYAKPTRDLTHGVSVRSSARRSDVSHGVDARRNGKAESKPGIGAGTGIGLGTGTGAGAGASTGAGPSWGGSRNPRF
ncbi:MAG: hypothetical protein M1828_001031 [Chrysothrix sp. TS-e1954]|nr:MAG: hypothetical protein M1828_001031 [Chrysothrix sp. TS-e1954]